MSEQSRTSAPVDQERTYLKDEPERFYTYAGHVAHLIAYGTDLGVYPYTPAYCGFTPEWPSAWLGTGSQGERDEAARLRTCKRCNQAAKETGDFVRGLALDFGMPDPKAASESAGRVEP